MIKLTIPFEISGITRFQSGQYFTPVSGTSTGTRRADYIGGEVLVENGERGPRNFINDAAFLPAPNDRRGTAGVGIIEGPGFQNWNISLRRLVPIREGVRLRFQAELFNAFNRANFRGNTLGLNVGNYNATTQIFQPNTGYGLISHAAPGRNVQFGLKLEF